MLEIARWDDELGANGLGADGVGIKGFAEGNNLLRPGRNSGGS